MHQCNVYYSLHHVYHPLGYIWNMGISFKINLMVLPWQYLGQKKDAVISSRRLKIYYLQRERLYQKNYLILKYLQQRQW